jgi:hypothetical protein
MPSGPVYSAVEFAGRSSSATPMVPSSRAVFGRRASAARNAAFPGVEVIRVGERPGETTRRPRVSRYLWPSAGPRPVADGYAKALHEPRDITVHGVNGTPHMGTPPVGILERSQ